MPLRFKGLIYMCGGEYLAVYLISLREGTMGIDCISRAQCAVMALALFAGDLALAKTPVILASGRRDPRIYAIDLNAALRPENNNTPNATVSRSLVSPRRLDGAMLGDPANIVLSDDQRTAYVMNHHGSIVNAEFLQHGGRANISIMDVKKMLRPEFDNTDAAVLQIFYPPPVSGDPKSPHLYSP